MIDVKEREAPRPRSASRPRAVASGNHGDLAVNVVGPVYPRGARVLHVTDTEPRSPPPGRDGAGRPPAGGRLAEAY